MKLRSILVSAGAAALAAAGAARADTGPTGQLTIGQFTYTLTDLAPNDGITPSITFTNPGCCGRAPATVMLSWSQDDTGSLDEVSAEAHEPITYSLNTPGLSLGGSVSGSLDPGTIDMHGYASLDGTAARAGADVEFWSSPLDFLLSPNTALTVTATAHFVADAGPAGRTGSLTSRAQVSFGGEDQNGPFSVVLPATVDMHPGDAPIDRTDVLTGSYANTSAASVSGGLSVYANVVAISSVPEPGQAALFAAGVPLLLLLRSRARRNPGRDSRHERGTSAARDIA